MRKYPSSLIPSNLAVTVYSTDGKPLEVLQSLSNDTNLFNISLDERKYMLLVSATWTQISGYNVSGYVLYSFAINVVRA